MLLLAGGVEAAGPRFVDEGNGTVAALVWLKNANCFGALTWQEAMKAAAGLESGACGLDDGSKPGDWRLPSVAEWLAMIKEGCEPSISDDEGSGCYSDQSSFVGVQSAEYWSSTEIPGGELVFEAILTSGMVGSSRRSLDRHVWPIRGGQ